MLTHYDINSAVYYSPLSSQVQRLVEMGFNRDNIMNALRATNNDINQATNILLHET
jgi:uncharacterized UBP type Zn finger protein